MLSLGCHNAYFNNNGFNKSKVFDFSNFDSCGKGSGITGSESQLTAESTAVLNAFFFFFIGLVEAVLPAVSCAFRPAIFFVFFPSIAGLAVASLASNQLRIHSFTKL